MTVKVSGGITIMIMAIMKMIHIYIKRHFERSRPLGSFQLLAVRR